MPDAVQRAIVAYRRVLIVVVHIALWTISLFGAFLLRFDFQIPEAYWHLFWQWLGLLIVVKVVCHFWFGLFRGLWRYTGARDLMALIKASTMSTLAFALIVFVVGPKAFPRSIYTIDWLTGIMVVGGLRFGIRTLREIFAAPKKEKRDGQRKILIVGAGDAGEMLMREISRTRRYQPVGFVDDDVRKHGEHIHGVPVLGTIDGVRELVTRLGVDEVIVSIPSVTGKEMRRIVDLCTSSGATIRTVPGVDHLIDGRVNVNQLQEVKIEDLLGREQVKLDMEAISGFVKGRAVLVTGAGGSIGSELCRQICRFKPATMILVEQAENNLFHIHRALAAQYPEVNLVPYIADICDTRRLEAVFEGEHPAVVFHAAAHKHVPMMEWNPGEAIKNNVFGTKKVADVSAAYGVEKFVMVSTDKAVNPTSIMGASKRTAEIYVQALSQRSKTQFVTVRFGNVLGSEGSVVPLFKEQIAKGGPVLVTHPDMKRYFMTIPEACQLVLQAGAMGKGGEIFILDMGEPVKVVDLARDLIKLSGLVPGEDIEIKFSGIRPGEKLFEELATDEEHCDKTRHEKILIGRFRPQPWGEVTRGLEELHALTDGADSVRIRRTIRRLVPEYLAGEIGQREERVSSGKLEALIEPIVH